MVSEGDAIDVDCPNECDSTVRVLTSTPPNPIPSPVSLTCEGCSEVIEKCSGCKNWTTRENGMWVPFSDGASVSEELVCPNC